MTGVYRLADCNIAVTSLYRNVHSLCKDYSAESDNIDFCVETCSSDIEYEKSRSARERELEGLNARSYSEGYLETLAVYRKIAEKLPEFNAFLIHGSCVSVDGEGYLFIAKSGTGKSTHTRLWREMLGEKAVMINDDKPLVRINGEEVRIYGTPWDGKHRLSSNSSVPLKGICLFERSEENFIVPVTSKEAYPMLLKQIYRPGDMTALNKTITLTDKTAETVPLWRAGCNMKPEAAEITYKAMKGLKI